MIFEAIALAVFATALAANAAIAAHEKHKEKKRRYAAEAAALGITVQEYKARRKANKRFNTYRTPSASFQGSSASSLGQMPSYVSATSTNSSLSSTTTTASSEEKRKSRKVKEFFRRLKRKQRFDEKPIVVDECVRPPPYSSIRREAPPSYRQAMAQ